MMNIIQQQGIAELSIILMCELNNRGRGEQMSEILDLVVEVFMFIALYLHLHKKLRWENNQNKIKARVENQSKKYLGLLKMICFGIAIILTVISFSHHDSNTAIQHMFYNIIQAVLLYLTISHYNNLFSFCEAVLFTKVCTMFVCLLFAFIPHYTTNTQDIAQVADLFLITAVIIPLMSLIIFKSTFKHIAIPLGFILIQLFILFQMVQFNPFKLIQLTLQEDYSILCLVFMFAITLIGIGLSQYYNKYLSKIMIRKIFHFQSVIIFTGGIFICPNLTLMAASGTIWVFFILEFLRQEFSSSMILFNRIDQFVSQFIDERDCKKLILTHIYLLLGVAYPFIQEYGLLHENKFSLFYEKAFSGILVLGIGDSFAAIIGKSIGKIKFLKTKKTVEGFAAFLGSVIVTVKFINYVIIRNESNRIIMDDYFYVKLLLVAAIECVTKQVDNLLLPIIFLSF